MTEGRFAERERKLVRALVELAEERSRTEAEIDRDYRETGLAAAQVHETTRGSIEQDFQQEMEDTRQAYQQAVDSIRFTARADYEKTRRTEAFERQQITEKAETNERNARDQWEEASWVTETVFEASEGKPEEQFQAVESALEGRRKDITAIRDQAALLLRKFRQRTPAVTIDPAFADEPASLARLDELGDEAQSHLVRLSQLGLARLFRGLLLPFYIVVILAAVGAPTALRHDWQLNMWTPIAAGSTLAGLLLLTFLLHALARRQVARVYGPLHEVVERNLAMNDRCHVAAEKERDRQETAQIDQRNHDLQAAQEKYEPIIEQIRERRDHHVARIDEQYPPLLEAILDKEQSELARLKERHEQRLASLAEQHRRDSEHTTKTYDEGATALDTEHGRRVRAMERDWRAGMEGCQHELEAIQVESTRLFPEWDDASWRGWSPPTDFAPSIRFGALDVNRVDIPGSIPGQEHLKVPMPDRFRLPATLDLPDRCSLLMLSDADGRAATVSTLQAVIFRLLTALPPGKVRFTIIDPVGLGQSFAGFMHLADYEESFVASRIWTETRHIEQRLADLTEHMETVIQKYLRNEFQTIAEYNEQAGEIAEPYRFLVISDFPASFSDTAVQRLASIVSSGARCGVYTLVGVDRRLPRPKALDLGDLEAHSTTLVHEEGRFVWRDDVLAPLPLTLEMPPPEALLTRTLHAIGAAAKDATRVEVPFEVIAPTPDRAWTGDCTEELTVPLGRCGATKLQELAVGRGTSQHALIAGKTGSGKSTLLHVLITNLALWYRPDEVEFYLVDFKKGVEFKTYATHELPHARAVAVESDREFGLSVLQRIDRELKRRGDRFRELGVQDLAGYRRLGLDEPLPRTLLIIDEFQEMFVEDDKLGQDAALLLDRLVRQGRAFGIHVILGSQTLGGAYTLARSTIGQMQIRVALQCSESDSYLIMSDDNAAARLLSRPGEAIYNDAGGAIEGNSPFQIVWLPDDKREQCLARVRALSDEHGFQPAEPQIVFEGNVPARIAGNHLLETRLNAPRWSKPSGPVQAWLGEAIAIKDPTSASLRRQSGSNLLIVGQRDEAALAMMATAMVSLASQHPPGKKGGRFYLLDGSPADSAHSGYLRELAESLPHETHCGGWRDAGTLVQELAQELANREDADLTDAPPIFLFLYALQRFRVLRRGDDFGFSMGDRDAAPKPDKHFGDLLSQGSSLGIHTITWCDTATNLNRTLDRGGLREFEMRALFQMSGADSTQLIDTPLAGRLGLRHALYYNEEDGVVEKFRPYALPNGEWLSSVQERLAAKKR